MKFTDRGKHILAGLFLLILSGYYVNSSMFYHSHVVKGETIFHSHIYSNPHTTSSEDGGHTLEVIKLISLLSDFTLCTQQFIDHVEASEPRLETIAQVAETHVAKFYLERCRSLRAPPAL